MTVFRSTCAGSASRRPSSKVRELASAPYLSNGMIRRHRFCGVAQSDQLPSCSTLCLSRCGRLPHSSNSRCNSGFKAVVLSWICVSPRIQTNGGIDASRASFPNDTNFKHSALKSGGGVFSCFSGTIWRPKVRLRPYSQQLCDTDGARLRRINNPASALQSCRLNMEA